MKPPSYIIAQMLHNTSVGQFGATNPTWLVTYGKMPEKDGTDNCITTFDFGATNDGRNMKDGEYTLHPKVQIRVRCRDYATGYEKAKAIEDYLTQEIASSLPLTITISGDIFKVKNVSLLGSVAYMGQDEKNERQHFSLNVQATISEV